MTDKALGSMPTDAAKWRCHVRCGDGFAQYGGMPFIVESAYRLSEREYLDRKRAPRPSQTEETFTPTLASTDPIATEAAPSLQHPTDETQASAAALSGYFQARTSILKSRRLVVAPVNFNPRFSALGI